MTYDWRDDAACTPATAHLFDPLGDDDRGPRRRRERLEPARAICSGCPVRMLCLEYGMDRRLSGIFGGELLRAGVVDRVPAAPAPASKASRPLKPHGTHAAFVRHKNHGEDPCPACVQGEREYHATRNYKSERAQRRWAVAA